MKLIGVFILAIVGSCLLESTEAFSCIQRKAGTPIQSQHVPNRIKTSSQEHSIQSSSLTRPGDASAGDEPVDTSSSSIKSRWRLRAVVSGLGCVGVTLLLAPRVVFASSGLSPASGAISHAAAATPAAQLLRPPISHTMEITLTIRLLFAAMAGSMVGWERSAWKHSAGIRTMALVALGAAAFTICSMYGFAHVHSARHDPSRIASNIVSGVGFIGAGVITTATHHHRMDNPERKHREVNVVHGLTTAAAIWLSAAVGMASGLGLYFIASTAAALTIGTLRFGRIKHPKNRASKRHAHVFRRQRGSSEMLDTTTWDEVPKEFFVEKEVKKIIDSKKDPIPLAKDEPIRSLFGAFNETEASWFLPLGLEDPEEQRERIRARARDDPPGKDVAP